MQDPILIEGQATGCFPDPVDERDREYDHLVYGSAPFDWEKGFDIEQVLGFKLVPNNQGKRLSCVAEAISMYAFILNCIEMKKTNILEYLKMLKMSVRSIYAFIALPDGGAYIREGFKVWKNRGVNFEESVPTGMTEEESRDKSFVNEQTDAEASIFRGKEFRTIVNTRSIDLIAQAMEEGFGVVVGFDVENNGTWRTVRPRVANYRQTGHAMYLGRAKLSPSGKKELWALNSWGEKVGEGGWQAFGEEWFIKNHVSNIRVMIDKTNSLRMKLLDKNGKPRKFNKYLIRLLLRLA